MPIKNNFTSIISTAVFNKHMIATNVKFLCLQKDRMMSNGSEENLLLISKCSFASMTVVATFRLHATISATINLIF
jgi:hypothetical protein